MEVPIDWIEPNPNNPRKHFDEAALEELAESIKQVGILEPLVVVWAEKPTPVDERAETVDEDEQKCRVCGCTDDMACPGGCYWVEPDLCSRCAEKMRRALMGCLSYEPQTK